MKKSKSVSLSALLAAGLVIGATACGGGAKADSPSAAAPTSKAPAQAAATAAPTATTAATAPRSLALVAINLLFDKKELKAAAGDVTIEFDNQDAKVPHNVHVFAGGDATGTSVGTTKTESGPIKQSLAVKLEEGSYFFQCDVHPTTMTGTITVD